MIGTFLSGSLLLTTAIIDYWPGAWYIEEVVLDAGAGKASFVGQAGNLVDLMFSEIEEFCSEKESTVEAPTAKV